MACIFVRCMLLEGGWQYGHVAEVHVAGRGGNRMHLAGRGVVTWHV